MYRVMIVDDEAVSQEYLRGLIKWEKYGFELTRPARNATEAKEILANEKVDVAVLDIFMPGESGVSLSSFISRQYPKTLMLAVSSHDDYDYVRQVLRNGAYDYILKHRMTEKTLLAALNNLRIKLDGKGDSGKNGCRRDPLYRWLFMKGEYPYLSSEGTCAAGIAYVPELEHMNEDIRSAIVPGILKLMEDNGRGIADVTVAYKAPDLFVSFYLFANTISQNEMMGYIFICAQKNKEALKQAYKLNYFSSDYPLITDYRNMPAHVASAIGNMHRTSLSEDITQPVALSLDKKRRFIAALEENNYAEVEYQIDQVYSGVHTGDFGTALLLANEFLDILLSAAGEESKDKPFSKGSILEWAKGHSIKEISERLKNIAADVLRRRAGVSDTISPYVKAALNIIKENYAKELSQNEVAAQVGLSPTYLSKLFKQEFGASFTETLNKYRINAAKKCLNNGVSIKETAINCGFKYYNYFITVFKNFTGYTPAEYLKHK